MLVFLGRYRDSRRHRAVLYGDGVGTFTHPITLVSATGQDSETIDALIDTGATFSMFPAAVLERLRVTPFGQIRARLANGEEEQLDLGQVNAELDGVRRPIFCLFGVPAAPPLIGAHALEAFLLMVDPVDGRLVPKEAYLMRAWHEGAARSASRPAWRGAIPVSRW